MTTADMRQGCRVLALDIRPRRFGFVCIETSLEVVDFGFTIFSNTDRAGRRIEALIDRLQPTVVVLRRVRAGTWRDQPRMFVVQRIAQSVARRSGIQVTFIPEEQLLTNFGKEGARNKYQIAPIVAKRFPDLSWRLPSHPRKLGEPEPKEMVVFDAAALVFVYLNKPD